MLKAATALNPDGRLVGPLAGIRSHCNVDIMKGLGFVAYGAGVAGAALYAAPIAIQTLSYLFEGPEVSAASLWLPIWIMATLGPLILSLIVWVIVQKSTMRWLPHLIFIPVAIIVWQKSMSLFLQISGLWKHDGPAGNSFLLGALYLLLTLLVHVSAFTMALISGRKRWANGS